MPLESALVCLGAAVLAACLTWLVRKLALAHGVLDIPNQRSSHSSPTPRGGGLAIVVASCIATAILSWRGMLSTRVAAALIGGGLAVAAIGFADDRRSVSAPARLAVHLVAAIWAVSCLGGLPPLQIVDHSVTFGWTGAVLAVFAIVWTLNLFNFMDGIDGIAASEAVFVGTAGAILTALHPGSTGIAAAAAAFAASCAAFLGWNWPPAKIFMGDVGSGFLGYVIAVLALSATGDNASAAWTWLILGGVFLVDATVTLIRRALRGARVHEAHRSHAYQWLSRKWKSHHRVTLIVIAINVVWLLPLAILADRQPHWSLWILATALVPLVPAVIASGAGRPEVSQCE